jgi:hypothetical protein
MGTPHGKGKTDAERAAAYRQRKKDREENARIAAISECKTQGEWFKKNRAELAPEKLQELQTRHETVLDMIEWIRSGHLVDATDPLYISPVGVDLLLADITEHGVTRVGSGIFRDPTLGPDAYSAPWEHNPAPPYWQTGVLDKLVAENIATANYAKLGYLQALPDGVVVKFLQKHGFPFDRAAEIVGWRIDHNVVSAK